MLPLSQRVLYSNSACEVEHKPLNVLPSRQGRYKAWDSEKLERAVKAVCCDGATIRQAAEAYGIPKSTLGDRISGKILGGGTNSRYLTDDEEQELVSFIIGCATIGYAKTVKEILAVVQRILAARGTYRPISYGWWEAFKKRHPNLSLRIPASLSKPRAMASNRAVLDHYFDLLEETLVENNLKDSPCQIYNMDESGMPLAPKPLKTIHEKGTKNAFAMTSSMKTQITIVACVNAVGQCLPPMVIWDRKQLRPELTIGEVPGTIYGLSGKGWMDQHLFEKWFKRHFLRYAPPVRPLLILLDGHTSHYSPEAITMAAEEQVLLFVLPPNTTHLSQPLDKGIFGPLKMAWRKVCHDYMASNPGQIIHRYIFSKLFNKSWTEAMTIRNIVSGFRTTGVYPVNRDAISLPGVPETRLSLSERTRLSFIPLYTPSKRGKFDQIDHTLDESCYSDSSDDMPQVSMIQLPADELDGNEQHMPLSIGCEKTLHGILKIPSPPSKGPYLEKKACARVLTSQENLKCLQDKEKKKNAGKGTRKTKQTMKKSSQEEEESATIPSTSLGDQLNEVKFRSRQGLRQKKGGTDVAIGITNVKKEASSPCDEVEIKSRGKQRLKQKTGDIDGRVTEVRNETSISLPSSNKLKAKSGSKQDLKQTSDVGVTDLRKKVSISPTNPSGDVKVKSITTESDVGLMGVTKKKAPSTTLRGGRNISTRGVLKQKNGVADVDQEGELYKATAIEVSSETDESEYTSATWWQKDLDLTSQEREILLSGKELNDRIINAGQKLLKNQFNHIHGFQSTLLGYRLKFEPISVKFDSVQIFHTGSTNHWVCISTVGSRGMIHVMDSLGTSLPLNRKTVLQICKAYSVAPSSSLKVKKLSVQQQQGAVDCGVYCMVYATETCLGNDVTSVAFDQKRARKHLFQCFQDGKMSAFPRSSRTVQRTVSKIQSFKLYCVCRMPADYDTEMVQCSGCCKRWYHFSCVGVKYPVPEMWKCSKCLTGDDIVSFCKPAEFL